MIDKKQLLAKKIQESDLFDADFYSEYYPEIGKTKTDPLQHYLRVGMAEMLRPSLEFDCLKYLEDNLDVKTAGVHPLEHYLNHGKDEGRAIETSFFDRKTLRKARQSLMDSPFFDGDFYLKRNPVLRSQNIDPILHYLVEGSAIYLDPAPNFSTSAYMSEYRELFATREPALLHYLRNGALVGETPPAREATSTNERRGGSISPDRKLLLARMEATSYFKRYGFTFDASGPSSFIADAVLALRERTPTCVIDHENPKVSILIPVYGQMPFVLSCLDSLAGHSSHHSIEIIVADDETPGEHQTQLLKDIPWIRYERQKKNLGFLENCNETAHKARGQFLVLVNSDIRVIDNWLNELIDTFQNFEKAGFVGSKLINADGTLQEAGGLYWSDGTPWNYGRGGNELDPRYSYARQVDWVSGASIAIPMAIWRDVGGFDKEFRPAYCEDVDLAFRIREQGYEIWYQPLSQAIHFEGMTHGRDERSGVKAYQVKNLKLLQSRWHNKLPGNRPGGSDPDLEANRSATKSMLVIDALTHTPDRDAGSAIGWQMLKAFRQLGFQQTYFPLHGLQHFGRYTEDYQRLGVEMIYSPFVTNFEDFVRSGRSFDYVLTHRYNVTKEVIDLIRSYMPTTRIIFVPADLHYLRMEREARLNNDRTKLILATKAKTEELIVFLKSDCCIPHSHVEKEVLIDELPEISEKTIVLPWIIEARKNEVAMNSRRDIMYLGGYKHVPNVDAVTFFVNKVWPQLTHTLGKGVKFLAVGDSPPPFLQNLASESVSITGYVSDVGPYFDQARVFVAPLRFGAGIKGKIIQSLAHGVPIVATSVAVEGIGLVSGVNCLVAETADDIADAITHLYSDQEMWQRLSNAGRRYVEENFSWRTALETCERALDIADASWMQREIQTREKLLHELRNIFNINDLQPSKKF